MQKEKEYSGSLVEFSTSDQEVPGWSLIKGTVLCPSLSKQI